jgi:hypothetical protein
MWFDIAHPPELTPLNDAEGNYIDIFNRVYGSDKKPRRCKFCNSHIDYGYNRPPYFWCSDNLLHTLRPKDFEKEYDYSWIKPQWEPHKQELRFG